MLALALFLPLSAQADPVSVADRLARSAKAGERLLVLHYHRPDGVYDGWNYWAWPEHAEGAGVALDQNTKFGPYAVIPVQGDTARVGFIVRKGEWEAKDVDHDRFVQLNPAGVTEAWLISGDPTVYTNPVKIDLRTRLTASFLDAPRRVTVAATARLSPKQRQQARLLIDGQPAPYAMRALTQAGTASSRLVYHGRLDRDVARQDLSRLTLEVPGLEPQTVYARGVLDDDAYVDLEAELGAMHSETRTVFRVWSPVSESVKVRLYRQLDDAEPAKTVAMKHVGKGVWEAAVEGDLHGKAYQYEYFSYGKTRVAADIHARAATPNSSRAVVVDMDRTDPEGWGSVPWPRLAKKTDEIIYEIHVRDYTAYDETAPAKHRGKYLGLIHRNPGDDQNPSTGLDHLLELGVTAVHLLPIQDFGNERHDYNWGYWTSLFDVAETDYASEPNDPMSAPRDLKAAIQGLHAEKLRVILDVVYNHTSSSGEYSPFHQSVPHYYFRTTDDGQLRNDAGVGNSVADERPMVRKYIIDSLKYWVQEYRVDGFRFDLLGTHHPETVQAIMAELKSIRPDLTIYGEPWTGGGPTYFPKGAQRGLGLAVFNDHLRNAIRGDLDGSQPGFATGSGGDVGNVLRGIAGAIDDFAQEPTETINYVSAHDNLTLWDKIDITAPGAPDSTKQAMQKLSMGIVLTSQGVAFLHGGSDLARTKGGNHNSYNAGDEVNAFDWPRKNEYRGVFDYTAGLVALRKAHPAFRMADDQQVRRNLRVLQRGSVVAFELNGQAVGDPASRLVVAYNGEPRPEGFRLPPGDWVQVVDHQKAGTKPLRQASGGVILPAYSMAVWLKD